MGWTGTSLSGGSKIVSFQGSTAVMPDSVSIDRGPKNLVLSKMTNSEAKIQALLAVDPEFCP